jgi:hypothetical protein
MRASDDFEDWEQNAAHKFAVKWCRLSSARPDENVAAHMTSDFDYSSAIPADFVNESRKILAAPNKNLTGKTIGLLATFTLDFLLPYFVVEGARRGLLLDLKVGPFNQIEMQLLDPKSDAVGSDVDVVLIAARIEDLVSDFRSAPEHLSTKIVEDAVNRVMGNIETARGRRDSIFIVLNFAPPPDPGAGMPFLLNLRTNGWRTWRETCHPSISPIGRRLCAALDTRVC